MAWVYLYNCLYMTSCSFAELAPLESPILQIFDELETQYVRAFHPQAISNRIAEGLVDPELSRELTSLYEFVFKIDIVYWNESDFDNFDDWKFARRWSSTLMQKLGMERKGLDTSGEFVTYVNV